MKIKKYTIPTATQQTHNKKIVVVNSLQLHFGLL